ncbi:MAG: DUF362 domain-containing protein [Patescibacteria group bacterium]|nr:DUF362 domain-containing protein [Patescibacteria group bacterium]
MAFYQCSKCKNKWQYNISKCPDCFLSIERIKNGKVKVIGTSKVSIPTILHPKVPYFVLILEDEKGNRWVQKSAKEYNINDEFALVPLKNKQAVSIWKTKYDIFEAIEKTIQLLGGLEINKNSKILILPTLTAAKHPYFRENTSPDFLENLLEFLKQAGADFKNIKIAAQGFDNLPVETLIQKSQLLNVALKYKITPLDLSKEKFIKKEAGRLSFEISNQAFENDLIINAPILKLDPELKIMGATNNLLTLLSKDSYLFLKEGSHQEILKKINEIVSCFNLAEGIAVKRADKIITYLGLIFASFDSLNLDRIFAETAMIKDLPEYLKDIKIENILVAGRQTDELKYQIQTTY